MNKIGIDIFTYTDMTHQDRHLNVKVRDVIQIYRIFNNLRDSGDDQPDEIKLFKLKNFPFFDTLDYENLAKKVKNKKPLKPEPKE